MLKQKLKRHGLWEFWRIAPAAEAPIIRIGDCVCNRLKMFRGEQLTFFIFILLPQVTDDLLADFFNFASVIFPGVCQTRKHIFEGRHIVASHGWEICACIKRFEIRRKKNRHGPSARTCHGDHSLHIDTVNVGAFLAVHFYVDEMFVHEVGSFAVFK